MVLEATGKISVLLKEMSQNIELQDSHKRTINELLPETLDELVDLIKELPSEDYQSFFKCINPDFTWHQVITLPLIKQLNQSNGVALLNALTVHPKGKDLAIHLALQFNHLTYIDEVLKAIPLESRFDSHMINKNNILLPILKKPEYLKMVLFLAPEKLKFELLTHFSNSYSQLSEDNIKIAIDPKYIAAVLSCFGKEERVKAFNQLNKYYGILEHASKKMETLRPIMELFDESEWVDVLNYRQNESILIEFISRGKYDQFNTVFSLFKESQKIELSQKYGLFSSMSFTATTQFDFFEATLLQFTKESRFKIIATQDQLGKNILFKTIYLNPGVEKLIWYLPKSDRQAAILLLDKNGNTLLHLARPEVLEMLLSHIPKEEQLKVLLTPNNDGNSALHNRGLNELLKLMPQKNLFEILNTKNSKGVTIFRSLQKTNLSLLALQSKLSAEEWYKLLSHTSATKNTLLHELACSTFPKGFCQILLAPLSDERRIQLLTMQNNDGSTALHIAVQRSNTDFMVDTLLSIPLECRYNVVQVQDKAGSSALLQGSHEYFMLAPKLIVPLLPANKRFEALTRLKSDNGKTVAALCTDYSERTKDLFSLISTEQVFQLRKTHHYSPSIIISVTYSIRDDINYPNKTLRDLAIVASVVSRHADKLVSNYAVIRFFQFHVPTNEIHLMKQLDSLESLEKCQKAIIDYVGSNPSTIVTKEILEKLNVDSLSGLKKHWGIANLVNRHEKAPLIENRQ